MPLRKVDCIFTQTKGYLAANNREFTYLTHYLFKMDSGIDIVTEDEQYHIDTVQNADKQKEALMKMAEEYISLNREDYEKWENEIRENGCRMIRHGERIKMETKIDGQDIINGIGGSQGATKNTLDQLNINYWRSVIDMAVMSGLDEREWCRANGVALNTYEKYRELLENEPAIQPEQDKHKKAIIGKDKSRYVEITRDGGSVSIEETDACGDSIRKPDYRSRYMAASADEGRTGREPEMVI